MIIRLALFFFKFRPPATVLAKPTPVRNRKDSSDAEPSPPNSPSYFEEDHVSSITVSLKVQHRKKFQRSLSNIFLFFFL